MTTASAVAGARIEAASLANDEKPGA